MEKNKIKTGIVSITGNANAGKSTLLNTLLKNKIAITSSKPQTTRFKIRGFYRDDTSRIVFVDTPGIHKTTTQFGRYMINEIISSFDNIDVVLLMADSVFLSKSGNIQKYLGQYKDFVDKSEAPIFLVLNKIDKLQKETVLEIIGQINEFYEFTEIIPISALKGFNTDTLIKVIKKYLNKGTDFKDTNNTEITDLSDKLYVSEIIREKIINLTKQEIPHSVACNTIELIQRNKNTIYINTEIIVERNSQKGIIIGKNGQMLKKIGKQSRQELQKYFDKKIYIELFVKVIENWRNSEKTIKQAGY